MQVEDNGNQVTVALSLHGDNRDYKEGGVGWLLPMTPPRVNNEKDILKAS